ncbi:hypothetical protein ADL03_15755 [Nocardia sp. NRRL S-836]|nr:hypothetical protein ADL03_15755 [Nocardia sp. NRRL S-836]
MPFARGDVWTVWAGRPTLASPVQLRIEEGTVVATPNPAWLGGPTVSLRPTTGRLDNAVDRDLAELLLSVPGVRSEDWAIDAAGSVDVPVAEPSTITDDEVTRQVTDELVVHHTDRFEGCLSPSMVNGVGGPVRQADVDLTLPECTQLVVALASLQYWRFELNTPFAAAATKRRGLRRARGLRGLTRH